MDRYLSVLQSLFLLTLTVVLEYRFACKTLGRKTTPSLTFFIMLVVHFMAGQLNVRFHLVGTTATNTLYFGIVAFLLYLFLFRGHVVKKLFFTILISFGIPISYYIFLPFVSYLWGQTRTDFLLALQILEYTNTLLAVAVMEYVGRKFQNLRRELPTGYTLYLSAVPLFVQVAVSSGYDQVLVRYDGMVPLPSAFILSAFTLVGIAIVMVAIFAVDRQVDVSLREQLHTIQVENFKSRELEWRKLSGFRHDIKNHLLCLSNLLENGKTEQAVSYMQNLTTAVEQMDSPVQTGNDYADALLSAKYAEALEANIRVSLEMAIPAQGYVQPIDLCCILSNAFDNAIAACKQLPEAERWIAARAFVRQGQFVVEVKNSKPPYVTVVNGEVSPKKITADHGLGLDTVKAVVAQYGGALNLSADDAFSFGVLLPQSLL